MENHPDDLYIRPWAGGKCSVPRCGGRYGRISAWRRLHRCYLDIWVNQQSLIEAHSPVHLPARHPDLQERLYYQRLNRAMKLLDCPQFLGGLPVLVRPKSLLLVLKAIVGPQSIRYCWSSKLIAGPQSLHYGWSSKPMSESVYIDDLISFFNLFHYTSSSQDFLIQQL